MTELVNFLNCRNDQCQSANATGGTVIRYKPTNNRASILCKSCKTEYIQTESGTYLKWGGKLKKAKKISSSADYLAFNSQYGSNRIYFPKLVLENIHEEDYHNKSISFNRCRIDELIIKNVSINAAFYPFDFSECSIGRIIISDCKITNTKRKDYRSLWSFFGINFFNTTISESFTLVNVESSLMMAACDIKCTISILQQSNIELAMLNLKQPPQLSTDPTSVIHHFANTLNQKLFSQTKEIKSSGGFIEKQFIEKLYIIPEIEGKTIIKDCIIRTLVFPSGKKVETELVFQNCYIENIINQPHTFEMNLLFLACTFGHELILSEANFAHSLVLEGCLFQERVIINDLKIEKDLHLNYCTFQKDITVSCINCNGYVKTQFTVANGTMKFEDNVIARELNIKSLLSVGSLIVYHNEVNGYMFLKQFTSTADLSIDMLDAEALTVDDVFIEKSLEIKNSYFRSDIRFLHIQAKDIANLFFLRPMGEIFIMNSLFSLDFLLVGCESKMNFITNNKFEASCTFNTCVYQSVSQIDRNIFCKDLDFSEMDAGKITFNDNVISGDFGIENSKLKNIDILDNHLHQSFSCKNTDAQDFKFNNNKLSGSWETDLVKLAHLSMNDNIFKEKLSITSSSTRNLTLYDNTIKSDFEIINTTSTNIILGDNQFSKKCYISQSGCNDLKVFTNHFKLDFELFNIRTKDIIFNHNHFSKNIQLSYPDSEDFIFSENTAQHIIVTRGNFAEISITECQETGRLTLYKVDCSKGLIIKQNKLEQKTDIDQCSASEDFIFAENEFYEFSITDIAARNIEVKENIFHSTTDARNIKTHNIACNNNAYAETFFMKSTEANNLYFQENKFSDSCEFNTMKADDVFVRNNEFAKDLSFKFVELGDLFLSGNSANDCYFSKSGFAAISIKECKIEATLALDTVTTRKSLSVESNIMKQGLVIVLGNITNELSIENNEASEKIYIHRTQADELAFRNNTTQIFELSLGRFRELLMNENSNLGEVKFNNFSVDRDISLRDNAIHHKFNISYCNVGNDFDMASCICESDFILFKNTIHGSLNLNNASTKTLFRLKGNYVGNNFKIDSAEIEDEFNMMENSVEQLISLENIIFNTTRGVYIKDNKFNFFRLENTTFASALYFENNVVNGSFEMGKRELNEHDTTIVFPQGVSFRENKIQNAMFYNLIFESAVCMHYNNYRGDVTFHNTAHHKVLDFYGSFVGGSFMFVNSGTETFNGDIILDNTFIDKRITFNNSVPSALSFKNATFNGFEIPSNWKMQQKNLIYTFQKPNQPETNSGKGTPLQETANPLKISKRKGQTYVLKECQLQTLNLLKTDLPYSLIKTMLESDSFLNDLTTLWQTIKQDILADTEKKKKLQQQIKRGEEFINAEFLFDTCLKNTFQQIYFELYPPQLISYFSEMTAYFEHAECLNTDNTVTEIAELLGVFSTRFSQALSCFATHSVAQRWNEKKAPDKFLKHTVNESLAEQYKVLRQIYGSNGELTNEDWAYYNWMHYKNFSEMNSRSLRHKLKCWFKYLVFEKIFGWGVDLRIILRSTAYMILLFSLVYQIMFFINPGLTISWDGDLIKAMNIDVVKTVILALQTTFSAVLGDWAPIGAGWIKIPMTINSVLGIFFVTFLVGAYGRKMLR